MLESIRAEKGVQFQVVALDPNGARREKMTAMVETIYGGLVPENVSVADLDVGKDIINSRTDSLGCNAVLEVSQGPSKLAFSQCLPPGCRQQQRTQAGIRYRAAVRGCQHCGSSPRPTASVHRARDVRQERLI